MGSGFRTFQSGEVLTSSNVQNYLMDQAVTVFAGTAARGSAIASPETGMVSYRTDGTADSKREGFEFYDGANWTRLIPVASSGLTYITGATFTTATSFSLPNNTFSSTYRNYRIIITVNTLTSDSDFTMRLRASGTDDSGNSYRNVWNGYNTVSSADAVVTNPATSFSMREMDSAANVNYSLVLDVIGPQVAFATNIHGQVWYLNKAATAYISSMVNGVYNAATQFDSLSFISSVASSMTGTYRVYGYADS